MNSEAPRRRITLRDGGTLAYRIDGQANDGTPLLLVRPLGGSSTLWGSFRTMLAQRHRVLSFDLRGTGESSLDPAFVSTKTIARDALELLEQLDIARAHVFGISLGGMASTWLPVMAPERIEKLVLACAPVLGVELSHASVRQQWSLASCFLRPRPDIEPALVRRILSKPFRRAHPDEVKRIEALVHGERSDPVELVKHAFAGFRHDARSAVGQIRCPVLVLAGENDSLLGTAPPRELASLIPGARFSMIRDSGHDLTIEQPAATVAAIEQFLAS